MRSALAAQELTILRTADQTSKLFIAVHRPATIFTARVNQATFAYPLATIVFDTGSGSDIKAGMTLWIGSSSGAKDKGTVRIRADLTSAASGTLSVAEFGQYAINVADNDFLTVKEDYRIAAKFPRWNGSAWVVDYNIAYSDQNTNYGPVAKLGPAAVGFLESAICKLKYVGERSAAYSPGQSINAWAWAFPDGQTSTSQGTTASPVSITYTAAIPDGKYHSLTVTESGTAKTHVSRRLTFIFDRTGANAPYSAVLLSSIAGGPEQGGYRANVRVINISASTTDFPDGAHVVLFKESRYGDYWLVEEVTGTFTNGETVTGGTSAWAATLTSKPSSTLYLIDNHAGLQPGEVITGASSGATARIYAPDVGGNFPYRSNILMEGWIVEETVYKNPATGDIEFEIATVDEMLKRELGYPVALTSYNVTPIDSWEKLGPVKTMTVNLAALHWALWRSTVASVVDFYIATGFGGVVLKYCDMDQTNLYDQVRVWFERTILGWVSSDLQSGLYCEANAQLDETTRSATITGWDMASTDRRGVLEIQHQIIPRNAQVTLYAVAWKLPLGSRSPDDPHHYQGDTEEVTEGLAVASQATLNTWAGNLRALRNSEYPQVVYQLAGNWPADAVPQSYIRETLSSSDTIRGAPVWTNQKLLIRETRIDYDPESQRLFTNIVTEISTSGLGGASVTFPTPSEPEPVPAPTPPTTPFEPPIPTDANEMWFLNDHDQIVYSTNVFDNLTEETVVYQVVASNPPTDQIWTNAGSVAATSDGGTVYVSGRLASDSTKWAIWKSANAKSTSPTWTEILRGGDTMGASTVRTGANPFSRLITWGTHLIVMIDNTGVIVPRYAEYNGSTWSFEVSDGSTLSHAEIAATYLYHMHLTTISAGPMLVKSMPGNGAVDSFTADTGTGPRGGQLWRNLIGGNVYGVYRNGGAGANGRVRNATGASDVLTGFQYAAAGHAVNTPITLRGALRAVHMALVDNDGLGVGVIYVSTNGTSFATRSTWKPGIADMLDRDGGSNMCWLLFNTTNANEFFRTSTDGFVTAGTARTGNYWVNVDTSGGAFNARDLSIVFRS